MKKVYLGNYSKKDRKSIYARDHKNCVALGNGLNVSFTSEKECKKFLSLVNNELNLKIDELNLIYMDLFREYRMNWRALSYENAGRLLDTLCDVGRLISRACDRSNTPNANHFVFQHLFKVCDYLSISCGYLKENAMRLNAWHQKRMLVALELRIEQVKASLNGVGR